jgi:hypothetical protein
LSNLSCVWKILKPGGPTHHRSSRLRATGFRPRCAFRPQPPPIYHCHRISAAYKNAWIGQSSPIFASSHLALTRSLCSPLLRFAARRLYSLESATPAHLLRHPSWGSSPPSPPLRVAPDCSPSQWLAMLGAAVSFRMGHCQPMSTVRPHLLLHCQRQVVRAAAVVLRRRAPHHR